ncbi:MAG: hypothetical protein R3B84_00065 [Zavarzinella sp.]
MRVLLSVLVVLAGTVASAQDPAKTELPKPLPEKIVKVWTEAGADVGWITVSESGSATWMEKVAAGSVPGFVFSTWKEGVIANLPTPETPFGLDLHVTQLTDDGLKELAGLKSLTTLILFSKPVTDTGLKELAGLKSLTTLDLRITSVTDAGLKELVELKSLTSLHLGATKVTDAGLKELAGLKSLTLLNLSGTQVTDDGLKELAGLKSLTSLGLVGTQVTDAGLKELAGLKSLTLLNLLETQVTSQAVAELQKALPKCRIVR